MTVAAAIVAGVDTHVDTIHVAAITLQSQPIADREFPTTSDGYRAAITFLQSLGTVDRAGVEGTRSYGAGFTRAAIAAGIEVVEVTRGEKTTRRRKGKSDPIDAYCAARTALAGVAISTPKDDSTTAIAALYITRRSAIKDRTAAINQLKALLVTAPGHVRDKYRYLDASAQVKALARVRPQTADDPVSLAVLTATKMLAQRIQFLEQQAASLLNQIDALATAANPALRGAYCVGPDSAAQLLITAGLNPDRLRSEAAFAALCGAAPVPASSGKTTRHRLSRGGDRGGNRALHQIAVVRMAHHQPTRDYVQRQTAKGHSSKEILRKLKRAIAREMFKLLTRQIDVPDYRDLRPSRQAKNITLTAAANHFEVDPTVISRIERGKRRNDELAERYRTWLNAA